MKKSIFALLDNKQQANRVIDQLLQNGFQKFYSAESSQMQLFSTGEIAP